MRCLCSQEAGLGDFDPKRHCRACCMKASSQDLCLTARPASGVEQLYLADQIPATPSANPSRGWKFTPSKAAWVGRVAAVEAKKAQGVSRTTLRIPNTPDGWICLHPMLIGQLAVGNPPQICPLQFVEPDRCWMRSTWWCPQNVLNPGGPREILEDHQGVIGGNVWHPIRGPWEVLAFRLEDWIHGCTIH